MTLLKNDEVMEFDSLRSINFKVRSETELKANQDEFFYLIQISVKAITIDALTSYIQSKIGLKA